MYPVLFQWGSFSLPSWHVLYVVGALVAYIVLLFLSRKISSPINVDDVSQLFLVCYAAGYFGARLLSIVVEEPHITEPLDVASALIRFGPMTFYGGAIAAFLAGTLFCLFRKISYGDVVDIGCIAGFLALAIGRVGCFLNGDDFGKPVSQVGVLDMSGLGVVIPVLGDGIPRWPVQIFESVGVLLMVLTMGTIKFQKRARPGMVGLLCVVLYANLRFGLEFLRDDFRGFAFGTWLSTSQFIALLTLALTGVVAPFWLCKKPSDFWIKRSSGFPRDRV